LKILILGASGMLGSAMLRILAEDVAHDVFGTARSSLVRRHFPVPLAEKIICGVDVENIDSLTRLLGELRPQLIVNCIGLVKQLSKADDPLQALPINALLPHRLARLCTLFGARLIHISTDCVFDGCKGSYRETDHANADDLYGRSKYLGEVTYPHTITLRTSIIGHELDRSRALVNWFLAQEGRVKGYRRAIFSGLPTVELARIVRDIVLPRADLSGLYHVSSAPINKYELLKLVAETYRKVIDIEPDDKVVIDRSLDASLFHAATGYIAPEWPDLVARMHDFR